MLLRSLIMRKVSSCSEEAHMQIHIQSVHDCNRIILVHPFLFLLNTKVGIQPKIAF